MKNILILGIGNILMGDEGVGVHTIKALEEKTFRDNVDILDGGTGGFHLMAYFQEYENIIMVDATMDHKPAGTISVIEPKFASDFPKSLSAHDIGLKDMIESITILGKLPKIYLITVTIDSIQSMQMELSLRVKKAIPAVIEKIEEIVLAINKSAGM
ncbi:MAG: HyaD/HybD family hydrogenase maturation endopeptidase [Ignavibacteriaceae bacterium]